MGNQFLRQAQEIIGEPFTVNFFSQCAIKMSKSSPKLIFEYWADVGGGFCGVRTKIHFVYMKTYTYQKWPKKEPPVAPTAKISTHSNSSYFKAKKPLYWPLY